MGARHAQRRQQRVQQERRVIGDNVRSARHAVSGVCASGCAAVTSSAHVVAVTATKRRVAREAVADEVATSDRCQRCRQRATKLIIRYVEYAGKHGHEERATSVNTGQSALCSNRPSQPHNLRQRRQSAVGQRNDARQRVVVNVQHSAGRTSTHEAGEQQQRQTASYTSRSYCRPVRALSKLGSDPVSKL